MSGTEIDPIDPTPIGPGLTALPMSPTAWDDLPDGQHAVTPDGTVWQRREGLWHLAPWWQGTGADEIESICGDPDEWAYDMAWTRKMVEEAKGALTPITLPGVAYPHDDGRCRQDSVDAAGFAQACRELARLADALGIAGTAQGMTEVVDAAIRRIREA